MNSIFYYPVTYTILTVMVFAGLLLAIIYVITKLRKIKNVGKVKWRPIVGACAIGMMFLAIMVVIDLVAKNHIVWSRSLVITSMEIRYEGESSKPEDLILVFKEGTIEVGFDEHLKKDQKLELVKIGDGRVLLRSNNSFYPIQKSTAKIF